ANAGHGWDLGPTLAQLYHVATEAVKPPSYRFSRVFRGGCSIVRTGRSAANGVILKAVVPSIARSLKMRPMRPANLKPWAEPSASAICGYPGNVSITKSRSGVNI